MRAFQIKRERKVPSVTPGPILNLPANLSSFTGTWDTLPATDCPGPTPLSVATSLSAAPASGNWKDPVPSLFPWGVCVPTTDNQKMLQQKGTHPTYTLALTTFTHLFEAKFW